MLVILILNSILIVLTIAIHCYILSYYVIPLYLNSLNLLFTMPPQIYSLFSMSFLILYDELFISNYLLMSKFSLLFIICLIITLTDNFYY